MKKNTKKITTVKTPQRRVVKFVKKDKKVETNTNYQSVNNAGELDWSKLMFTIPTQTPIKTPIQKDVSVLSMIMTRLVPTILFFGLMYQFVEAEKSSIHIIFIFITIIFSTLAWYEYADRYENTVKKLNMYREDYVGMVKDNIELIDMNKDLINMLENRKGGH